MSTALLHALNSEKVAVNVERTGEAEMNESQAFVAHQENPRWLQTLLFPA